MFFIKQANVTITRVYAQICSGVGKKGAFLKIQHSNKVKCLFYIAKNHLKGGFE